MKFALIILLLGSCVAAIHGDLADEIVKVLESPEVQESISTLIASEFLTSLSQAYSDQKDYETRGSLYAQIDDPLIVADSSFIIPDFLEELIVGNLTACSVDKEFEVLGLSTVTNYTRLTLLPIPIITFDAELRILEFVVQGRHLVNLGLPDIVGATLYSFGGLRLALSKGFANIKLKVDPHYLSITTPLTVQSVTFDLGFDSLSVNTVETVIGGVAEVDWVSFNEQIKPLFDFAVTRIKTTVEPILVMVVQGIVSECSLSDFLDGGEALQCMNKTRTYDDVFGLMDEEGELELIAQCQEGPMLIFPSSTTPAEPEVTTPTAGTGSTEGSTGSTEGTTENSATVIKSGQTAALFVAIAMLLSGYFL